LNVFLRAKVKHAKGRFGEPVSETAQRYSESVSFDQRLYHHDIAVLSRTLRSGQAGIITAMNGQDRQWVGDIEHESKTENFSGTNRLKTCT